MTSRKKGRYQQKIELGLVPHRYSDLYHQWRAAVRDHLKGKSNSEMLRLGRLHSQRFCPDATGRRRDSFLEATEAAQ